MKLKYMAGLLALVALSSCDKGGFQGPDRSMYDVVETMTLSASAQEIVLDAEAPNETVLTFNWTPAREMPEEYLVTYVTQLDIEGDDFSNSIREVEEDGVFEKSYTNQQLQDYLVNKWGKSYARAVNVEFRVIAKWEGGNKYVMPEVRETAVSVKPFRPLVFEADRVYLSGSSLTGTTRQVMPKTPENEFIYAEEVYLKPGELSIPIEYDGATTYICPVEENAVVEDIEGADGKPVSSDFEARVRETEMFWQIPSEGYYRVIIDMENKTVKFFSPKNRLESYVAEFYINGVEKNGKVRKTITTLLTYGAHNWSGGSMNFVQSKTDPQLLICKATYTWGRFNFKSGKNKSEYEIVEEGEMTNNFGVSNVWTISPRQEDFAYTDSPNSPHGRGRQDGDALYKLGEWIPISCGASFNRGSYWCNFTGYDEKFNLVGVSNTKISAVTIDLRNMRMRLD